MMAYGWCWKCVFKACILPCEIRPKEVCNGSSISELSLKENFNKHSFRASVIGQQFSTGDCTSQSATVTGSLLSLASKHHDLFVSFSLGQWKTSRLKCYRQQLPTSPKKKGTPPLAILKKKPTKEFSLNSPRFGPAAGISFRLHRPAWSGFNPASLSAWEMRNSAALGELDKHKEQSPQRAGISQTSAAWQTGQPGLILEWWLLPLCIHSKIKAWKASKRL